MSTRFESSPRGLHAADLRSMFVSLLDRALQREDFLELNELRAEEVPGWALRRGVDADCVIQHLRQYCEGGFARNFAVDGESWAGPPIPQGWRRDVARMNALPVDPWWTPGVYGDVLDTESVPKDEPDVGRRFRSESAISRCSAPIAADPARESLDQFLGRATLHWHARGLVAGEHGLRPSFAEHRWRNADRDLRWVVAYQFERRSFDDIAEECKVEPEAVKIAVDRMVRLLGIRRPRGKTARSIRRLKGSTVTGLR